MTRRELENYLYAMAESGRVVNSIIIDGVSSAEDRIPAENYVRKIMGSLDQVDVIFIEHEKPNLIKVDEIREQVCDNVVLKPYGRPYKVYFLDMDLVDPKGQNILLKTLEEPPAYAIFILYTKNSEMLLETIRSRCLILKLGEGEKAFAMAPELREEVRELASAFPFEPVGAGLKKLSRFSEIVEKEQGTFDEIFDIIIGLYKEALVSKSGRHCPKEAARLAQQTQKELLSQLEALQKCKTYISVTVNKDVAFCDLIEKMRSNYGRSNRS